MKIIYAVRLIPVWCHPHPKCHMNSKEKNKGDLLNAMMNYNKLIKKKKSKKTMDTDYERMEEFLEEIHSKVK